MANLNRVFLMGNLTRDPELRYTPSGTPVCEFGLAVNRTWTGRDGEQREETCFVDITMWGRRGVVISEYFTKGKPIFVEGRLKYDTWETPDGRRSKLRVVANDFQFIGGRGRGGGGEQGRPQRRATGAARQHEAAEESEAEEFDVSDDEIPF
jgi:single-strand DNA-binding protein